MTTCFYHIATFWQIALLVFSQLTLISFVISIVILYKRSCKTLKLTGVVAAFLLNGWLYVLMQLSSRITGTTKELHSHIPYAILVIVVALSLVYNLWALISETNWRKTISRNSIKEAFDNLPTGVCFFNDAGLAILCNKAMQRFSFSVCGRDVQIITDIEECFDDDFVPMGGVTKEGTTFVLPGGTVWKLMKSSITNESGNTYTEYTATNITKLYNIREELRQETEHLRKVQEELKTLSANVVTITREEEILNTKMRVHDEMGRCLLAIQKYLKEESAEKIPESLVESWQKAVSMLKYNNDVTDDDMLLQIRKTCESIKLDFVQVGELPKEEKTAYILICAIRECVTNAVRYAEATRLYAEFTENETTASVTVTNNGIPPTEEISEGGGLSSLRSRVERFGGEMYVQSLPKFRLTVTVPKRKEGVL
jgi:hypothetical protein